MFKALLFLGLCVAINSQTLSKDDLSAPTPYQFSYTAPAVGGSSSHQESGDEYGRKTGSYTVQDDDGRQRIVEYVADEDGFRASISTNEPGTSNQDPADVSIESSAEEGVTTLSAPAPAVIPVAPVAPVIPVRLNPPPAPQVYVRRAPNPVRARAPLPLRPIPLQPALYPLQPIVNYQPTILPYENRFFDSPSAIIPIEAPRLVPQVLPFSGRPTLIPLDDGIPQPTFLPFQDQFYPSGYGNEVIIRPY